MAEKEYDTWLDLQRLTVASIQACATSILGNLSRTNKLTAEELAALDRMYYEILEIQRRIA